MGQEPSRPSSRSSPTTTTESPPRIQATHPRRLLDKSGAALYLDTSTDQIDRLIQCGLLPVVRLPVERAANGRGRVGTERRIHIDVRDLDALIERSKESRG